MWANICAHQGPENIRSTVVWMSFILLAGAVGFNAVLPNNDIQIATSVLNIVFATMVLILYGIPALKAMFVGSAKYTDYLIVGIFLSWLATDAREIIVTIARLANVSPTLLNSELLLPVKLLYPIAAILHVLPKGAVDGIVPKGNKVVVGVTFAIAAMAAFAVLVIRPETGSMIESMPTWLKDFWAVGKT